MTSRYQGHRIDEWLDAKLEGWLGLGINREKTKVVHLHQAESLDFLGFTFRYGRDLYGNDNTYKNLDFNAYEESLQESRMREIRSWLSTLVPKHSQCRALFGGET